MSAEADPFPDEHHWLCEEVALAWRITHFEARRRVEAAVQFAGRLGCLQAALAAGEVSLAQVVATAEGLAPVADDALATRLAERLLERLGGRTPGRARAAAERAAMAADRALAEQVAERGERCRDLQIRPGCVPGSSELWALLPTADRAVVRAAIERYAQPLCRRVDRHLRAIELHGKAVGRPDVGEGGKPVGPLDHVDVAQDQRHGDQLLLSLQPVFANELRTRKRRDALLEQRLHHQILPLRLNQHGRLDHDDLPDLDRVGEDQDRRQN